MSQNHISGGSGQIDINEGMCLLTIKQYWKKKKRERERKEKICMRVTEFSSCAIHPMLNSDTFLREGLLCLRRNIVQFWGGIALF